MFHIYKDKKNKYPVKLKKLIASLRHVSKKVLLKELNKLLLSGEYEVFSTPAEIMTLLLSKDGNPNQFLSILSEAVEELDEIIGNKGNESIKDQAKWVTRDLLERYAWDIPVPEKADKSRYFYCIKNNNSKGYIVGGTNKYLCITCKNALNFYNW